MLLAIVEIFVVFTNIDRPIEKVKFVKCLSKIFELLTFKPLKISLNYCINKYFMIDNTIIMYNKYKSL